MTYQLPRKSVEGHPSLTPLGESIGWLVLWVGYRWSRNWLSRRCTESKKTAILSGLIIHTCCEILLPQYNLLSNNYVSSMYCSVTKSYLTSWDSMGCSMPGFPVLQVSVTCFVSYICILKNYQEYTSGRWIIMLSFVKLLICDWIFHI